jgi:hypothetical protein
MTRILKIMYENFTKKGAGSEIRIRDPEKIHPGSQIQGVKKHWIPDLDPQH